MAGPQIVRGFHKWPNWISRESVRATRMTCVAIHSPTIKIKAASQCGQATGRYDNVQTPSRFQEQLLIGAQARTRFGLSAAGAWAEPLPVIAV